jgi:hypothetical protein
VCVYTHTHTHTYTAQYMRFNYKIFYDFNLLNAKTQKL